MRSEVDAMGMEWSIRQIKAALAPYQAIHCERQSGKTSALLDWVHEQCGMYQMRIGFITHDWNASRRVENEYNLRWPHYECNPSGASLRPLPKVLFIPGNELDRLNGITRTVVVDEWWLLRDEDRRKLIKEFQVLTAVGTIRSYSQVPLY